MSRYDLLDFVASKLRELGIDVSIEYGTHRIVFFEGETSTATIALVGVPEVSGTRARWDLFRATWPGLDALTQFRALVATWPPIYLDEIKHAAPRAPTGYGTGSIDDTKGT